MTVQGIPAIVKHITGHVDNSAYPAITVDIHADVVTPASTKGTKVPVIIGGGSIRPRPAFTRPRSCPRPGGASCFRLRPMRPIPPSCCLAHGWGFVGRNSGDVQADNGAGLDKGIIGLVNKGQPRQLDDWGVLRAWAWGDSKLLDYLQTDPDVDGKKVGVMGHSRGGKAALVAEVDDPRFAIGFISSSGAGGADLYRRNYGETMGNIAGTSEFHWFAGNFMRYGAAGHSANEMPVDSHEFIALVAPRAIFIGGGALITDPVNMFPAMPGRTRRACSWLPSPPARSGICWAPRASGQPHFPPMGTLIDSGDVAFRQHQYGHTPAPNWPYFIEFADKEFKKR